MLFGGDRKNAPFSQRGRIAPAAFGIMLVQAGSPQQNWWDGFVESWLNLPAWAQALVAVGAIAFVVALTVSLVLWVIAGVEERRLAIPLRASIRHGWLALPGWSKAVQFSLLGLIVLAAFSGLSGRPAADLRASSNKVVFGGVVSGGTATSDLTLTNLGTAGSPSIVVEQVTVSGEHAALFTVVSGADAVVPSGSDAIVTIAFSPDSTGLKVANLAVEHTGANSPTTIRLNGRGASVIRMNAGGRELADSPVWADDRAYLDTERTAAVDEGGVRISLAHPSIPADVPSGLFQSARVSETSSLAYAIPVEPGIYEVRLFFSELSDVVRSNLLDVAINGEVVVDQLNVAALAGPGGGLMVPVVVRSTADTISVEIQSFVGSPWVNAIEVVDVSQSSGSQLDAPADLPLGPVQMPATVSTDLILRNDGDRLIDPTVVISAIELESGTDFALEQLEATAVGHGNQARGIVALTPSFTGPQEASLSIDHSGAATPHVINVNGFSWKATDDIVDTLEDEPVIIAVLANDGDPEGSVLTVSSVDRPSNGVASTDGLTVTYQPNLNFNGEDTFNYRVRDSNGAFAEASVTVVVADINDPPHANANGPYIGSTGVPVTFGSAGSSDPDGTISRYSWTFGDGSSSTARNPSHTYGEPGTHTAVLRVTDEDGATATSSTSVRIDPRLSVVTRGDGLGAVVTAPGGINCGATCSQTFLLGSSVTVSATPATGSVFVGWTKGCSGTGGCVISMNDDRTVGAEFRRLFDLNVNKAGTGVGTVTSTPAGINCGTDCAETLVSGDTITLTALPVLGSTFAGWSGGGCFGVGNCTVTMDGPKTVTASFTLNSYLVSVAKSGSGTVTSSPEGINCGLDCSQLYTHGTPVTLTRSAPLAGWTFAWGGDCSGSGATCSLTMTGNRNVTATYTQTTRSLSVSVSGSGSVTGPGVSCPGDCSETYAYNTPVTLTRSAPLAGWTFAWGGDCSGSGATCSLTMTGNRNVTATYTQTTRSLSVSVSGSGSVSSSPFGISCPGDCSQSYLYGTPVTLTRSAPLAGWTFAWGGDCSGVWCDLFVDDDG